MSARASIFADVERAESGMSMETHVFFRGKLPSKAALARAMKELGFPLSITPATGSLERQSGFMPMRLRREDETGVEFDVFNGREAVDEFEVEGVDASFDRSANFRWGGDESELQAALCASAALAKLVNGVVFDEESGKLMSADDAVTMATEVLKSLAPPPERKTRQPGTRPADIKRYLKPLLELRDDLVLINRHLIIRPVRHLLRGAMLGRTSDKYQFRVWRYIQPLYDGAGVGYGDYIHLPEVWQPHSTPMLIDSLAEDVFASVGTLTSLGDLAAELSGSDRFAEGRVIALVLAGERERALEFARENERSDDLTPYWRAQAKHQLEFLDRDIEDICAEFHEKEAEAAKALKLGDIWQPSPFPVELPEGERVSRSADPLFVTTPWIARPAGLIEEAPARPGEVRFAKDRLHRDGCVLMLVPLTVEQAEERHRSFEDYVLVSRLSDGVLLVLRRRAGPDRHEPDRQWVAQSWPVSLHLNLYSPSYRVMVSIGRQQDDFLWLSSIDVCEQPVHRSVWLCYLDNESGEKGIYDSRVRDLPRVNVPLAAAERDLATCRTPAFGEFEDLVRRVRALLQSAGYGEIR